MLELYGSCINQLLQQLFTENNIVTTELAGGKKYVFINKTVMSEV